MEKGLGAGTHLGRDAGMLDHCPRVGGQAAHGATDVTINLHDLFDRVGLEQGGLGALLDGEDDALRGLDADGCRAELRASVCVSTEREREISLKGECAYLDGLDGILDYEQRDRGSGPVIA